MTQQQPSGIRRLWSLLTVVSLATVAAYGGCESTSLSSHSPDGAADLRGSNDTGGAAGPIVGGGGSAGASSAAPSSGGTAGGSGGIFRAGTGGTAGSGDGGSGNAWTDPNCYMRCGQGNAIYFGGGGRGGMTGAGGVVGSGGGGQTGGPDGTANECSTALPLHCGDQLNHSTLVQGRADVWSTYPVTQRLESGRETIYELRPDDLLVMLQLKNLTTDLDVFLLSACDTSSSIAPTSRSSSSVNDKMALFEIQTGKTYYVVVDGYDGAAGSYTLEVDCTY